MRILNKLSVRSKVLAALLSVTLITASVVVLIAVVLGVSTLKEEAYNKLTAVRELKANQIESYFRLIKNQVLNFAQDNDVVTAMRFFRQPRMVEPNRAQADAIIENLKNYTKSFGYKNLYLVNNETGKILYSVFPEIAAGTSLTENSVSETNLARAFKRAASTVEPDFTFQTDFEHSWPSGTALTSFISAPVYEGKEKIGVLIYQIPIEWINKIMTDNQDWGSMGLGRTGETYLAGADNILRNQSRFFIEDSSAYFFMLRLAGTPAATISRIRDSQTSIGTQPVSSEETRLAFRGGAGTETMSDYRGVRVLAAYKHLSIKDLNWVIISKIDRAEVLQAITELFTKFCIYLFLWLLIVISFSIVFARDLSRPVDDLAIANEQLKTQTAAIKSAANGIIITDIQGIVKWVNPAFTRLTGYEFGEIVGNGLKMLNSGVQSREFYKNMWTRILAGEVWHDEVVNRRKDGTLYTEEMTITPVKDSQGKISQFVAIKQDISERKRLEQIVKSANERMEGELNVARNIQMSMLPLRFPAFPDRLDIDVYAKLIPAREVGGDFYDFYFIDEENFCFVVGDVSGKGVPAALFMAVAKALIKAGASNARSTAKILTSINREISKGNDNTVFITVFLAILNTTTGHLVYTNAGHNPSFLVRHGGTVPEKLGDLHGVAIGAIEGVDYQETVVQLNRGDALFAYTDGVTEAQDAHGQLFTGNRLAKLLANTNATGCRELVELVLEDVYRHENGAEHADDITLLTVQFRDETVDYAEDFLCVHVTNKIGNINNLIEQFEASAAKRNVPVDVVQKLNIVFDELLSNTIKYAYQDDLEHEIELRIRFYKDKLITTMLDDGMPFNPFDRKDPNTSLPLEEREVGGLGVFLVKLLVDDYSYEYKNQIKKNLSVFRKSF